MRSLLLSCGAVIFVALGFGSLDAAPLRDGPEDEQVVQQSKIKVKKGCADLRNLIGASETGRDSAIEAGPVDDYSLSGLNPRIENFLDFAAGNYELSRKMADPFYRHRVTQISSSWGPLYYRKTLQYHLKGIYLARFSADRIRLGLFKRRLHYREIFGKMWSDHWTEALVEANHPGATSRLIFRGGRDYFLQLSYHF